MDEAERSQVLVILAEIKTAQVAQGATLQRLDHALYGNGKPGLLSEHGVCQERLRRIEEDGKVCEQKKFVKEMIRYGINAAIAAGIAAGIVKGVK